MQITWKTNRLIMTWNVEYPLREKTLFPFHFLCSYRVIFFYCPPPTHPPCSVQLYLLCIRELPKAPACWRQRFEIWGRLYQTHWKLSVLNHKLVFFNLHGKTKFTKDRAPHHHLLWSQQSSPCMQPLHGSIIQHTFTPKCHSRLWHIWHMHPKDHFVQASKDPCVHQCIHT